MKDEPADAPFGPMLRHSKRLRDAVRAKNGGVCGYRGGACECGGSPRLCAVDGWIDEAVAEFERVTPGLVRERQMRERKLTPRAREEAALVRYIALVDERERGERDGSDHHLAWDAFRGHYKKPDKAADGIDRAIARRERQGMPVPPKYRPARRPKSRSKSPTSPGM